MTENRKRLIDASQENIKSVLGDSSYYPDEIWKFVAMAERFPTVDAVEAVRCRDCKHMIMQSNIRYCTVWHDPNGMGDDGFCNYGERKDGDGNGKA